MRKIITIILILGILLALSFVGTIWILNERNGDDTSTLADDSGVLNLMNSVISQDKSLFASQNEVTNYRSDELSIEFDYPKSWNRRVDKGTQSSSIELFSDADDSFVVMISGYFLPNMSVTDCEPYTPCAVDVPREQFSYDTSNFHSLTSIDDKDILLSNTGGVEVNYSTTEDKLSSRPIELEDVYFLYQKDNENLYSDLAILDYKSDDARLEIRYMVNSQNVIDNWSEYEAVLKEIVSSIKSY